MEGRRPGALRVGQGNEIRSVGPPLGFQRQWAIVDTTLGHRLTREGIHCVLRIVQIMIPRELNVVKGPVGALSTNARK